METIILTKSKRKDKKYTALVNGKKISFGQYLADDYTTHHDLDRLLRYVKRHYKREKELWNTDVKSNLESPSFWSRYLLWNEKAKTIPDAIKWIEKTMKVDIKSEL